MEHTESGGQEKKGLKSRGVKVGLPGGVCSIKCCVQPQRTPPRLVCDKHHNNHYHYLTPEQRTIHFHPCTSDPAKIAKLAVLAKVEVVAKVVAMVLPWKTPKRGGGKETCWADEENQIPLSSISLLPQETRKEIR